MKIIDRYKRNYKDSVYVLSTGWGEPCDIRLEIIDKDNWWDIFMDLKELEFLQEMIESSIIKIKNDQKGVVDE